MSLDIEKFSPTKAELAGLVEKAKAIDLLNPFDDMQLAIVKNSRGELRSTRTAITKRGKELRDDALAFQRAVIATERDLIAIIEPEEERLATLIEAATELREREARRELLPHRMERLAAIRDEVAVTEAEILEMDGPGFEGYFNKRQADQNEKIRLANEAKERALRAEEELQQREREAQGREERARREERDRLEREREDEVARALQDRKEKEHKAEEKRRLEEQDARFQTFLQENGYTLDTAQDFKIDHYLNKAILWKKVAVFIKTE